jgi:hypothetical protein
MKREFIIILFRLHASSSTWKKFSNVKKKSWKVQKVPLNTECSSAHTTGTVHSPLCMPWCFTMWLFTASLITHITVIEMLTIMQALMCYITNLLTKCLITDITAICAVVSKHVLCYHVSLYNVWHYTQLRNMGAHHCVYVDVLKSLFLKWMSFFFYYSNNSVHQYVCVGVLSCHSFEWMPYSSHYSTMGAHHYVHVCVL